MSSPPGVRLRLWPPIAAVPFFLYFGLLVYCEVNRLEPPGLTVDRSTGRVAAVAPGSPAAAADIAAGDRLMAVNGQPLPTSMAWRVVEANLEAGTPLRLTLERDGTRIERAVVIRRAATHPTRDRLTLWAARLVQGVTLMLAVLLAVRRPTDPVAVVAAAFLGGVGVFTVELPLGFAAAWRALPRPVELMLWLPFLAWMAAGPLWFAFSTIFPVATHRARRWWLPAAVPCIGVLAWHLAQGLVMVYRPHEAPAWPDWSPIAVTVSMAYAVAGLALLVVKYRQSGDANERRRLRVVALGSFVGLASGLPLILGRWLAGESGATSIFSSSWHIVSMLLLLTFPVSFAYAIVRHRMFDVALIVRQGLRYTLARRLLLLLVPALAATAVLDALLRADRPLGEVLRSRAPVYLALLVVIAVAWTRREVWLRRLDQRFFRERYNAQQVLSTVVEEIRLGADFRSAAGTVVRAVHDTLHPLFVQVLLRPPQAAAYAIVASAPEGPTPQPPTPDSKVIGMLRVLWRPLMLLPSDTRWLDAHLPADERATLRSNRVDLLMPISSPTAETEALLVLGEKRSEEPYSDEDRGLLSTIAHSLGIVLERHPPMLAAARAGLEECAMCGTCHDAGTARCEAGHSLQTVALPRVLSGRYRLDRRLAQGGMGTVYVAQDLALARSVAVKVIREEILDQPGALARFEREGKHLASFAHPHVVTVHDVGIAGGRPFLVMERVAGVTLRDELRASGRFAPSRVNALLKGVCDAVEEAHRVGLVHRDLKPENVMLTGNGREHPKIVDFGVARAWHRPAHLLTHHDTDRGVLVGTLPYMPPEQLRGQEPGPYSDIWALGVMTYEMLTGRLPFQSPLATTGTRADVPLSSSCGRFLDRALSLDPGDRPTSAKAFLAALEEALR